MINIKYRYEGFSENSVLVYYPSTENDAIDSYLDDLEKSLINTSDSNKKQVIVKKIGEVRRLRDLRYMRDIDVYNDIMNDNMQFYRDIAEEELVSRKMNNLKNNLDFEYSLSRNNDPFIEIPYDRNVLSEIKKV